MSRSLLLQIIWKNLKNSAKVVLNLIGKLCQAEEAVGRGDAGQRHVAGRGRKKMVTPAARREAAAHLHQVYGVSQRRA